MGNDGSQMSAMESKIELNVLYLFKKNKLIKAFWIWKECLFNLKFAAKELERSAKKCEKDNVTEKAKLKRVFERINECFIEIFYLFLIYFKGNWARKHGGC